MSLEYDKCDEIQYSKNKILCGCPKFTIVPIGSLGATSFTIANLKINNNYDCKPVVNLKFTSNIIYTGFAGIFIIKVYRQCNNELTQIPVTSDYILSLGVYPETTISGANDFSFMACDVDSCNKKCCNYIVTATVISPSTAGVLTINNATLSAIISYN